MRWRKAHRNRGRVRLESEPMRTLMAFYRRIGVPSYKIDRQSFRRIDRMLSK